MSLSRQESFLTTGRQNQKLRTRLALVDAALRLTRDGHSPSIAEVAEEARVSVATAYRYFPNPQAMWSEVAAKQANENMPEFLANLPEDPEERIDAVVRKVAGFQLGDEAVWRGVLRATLDRWFSQTEVPDDERVPVRGNTRLELARVALEPLRDRIPADRLERLINSVALVYGVEAMITTRDTCGLSAEAATETMSWAARALVRAALAERAS
jgi:AcrR family transcriptional regulator